MAGDPAARRHRFGMWFWAANIPPIIVLYFVLGFEAFVAGMALYTAVASAYANSVGHAGAAQACEARVAVEDSDSSSS